MIFAKNFLYVSFTLLILGLQASLSESTFLFPIGLKLLKPIEPVKIDCHRDHQITVDKDNNIRGVLRVKSCPFSPFIQKPSMHKCDIKIDKVLGDKDQTVFHYSLPCEKSNHDTVIAELKNAVSHPSFHDSLIQAKRPDSKESSFGKKDGKEAAHDNSFHNALTQPKRPNSKEVHPGQEDGKDAAHDHSFQDRLTQPKRPESKEVHPGQEDGKDAAHDHSFRDRLTQPKRPESKEVHPGQGDGKDAAC
ncbi:unnamed protein product [Rotaria socialis]|uniref:Uncharacterized protein n=1 Tax=Rotaria socialis TaxID=392032 RepID=A0A821TWI6_9BILA|nr:unnamed protein product [Rotaria socialis]